MCVCAVFILLVFAELLGFVVGSLGHHLFKQFLCFILFVFYFWDFIFKYIRLYLGTHFIFHFVLPPVLLCVFFLLTYFHAQ